MSYHRGERNRRASRLAYPRPAVRVRWVRDVSPAIVRSPSSITALSPFSAWVLTHVEALRLGRTEVFCVRVAAAFAAQPTVCSARTPSAALSVLRRLVDGEIPIEITVEF
jgi:hypothetical protein